MSDWLVVQELRNSVLTFCDLPVLLRELRRYVPDERQASIDVPRMRVTLNAQPARTWRQVVRRVDANVRPTLACLLTQVLFANAFEEACQMVSPCQFVCDSGKPAAVQVKTAQKRVLEVRATKLLNVVDSAAYTKQAEVKIEYLISFAQQGMLTRLTLRDTPRT
jgi:hypothetical protein